MYANKKGDKLWIIEDMYSPELFYFQFILIASQVHSNEAFVIGNSCKSIVSWWWRIGSAFTFVP